MSRLVSYKKISLIVKAFNQLGKPLVVIGGGSELKQIQALAGSNVQVLGWQPEAVVEQYLAQAKAFVYAAFEDFGIAPVEAQACGTPVIAYGLGGTLETVRDVKQYGEMGTGLLFYEQTEDAIAHAVKEFERYQSALNSETVRSHALSFSPTVFQDRYQSFLKHCYEEFQQHLSASSKTAEG